MQGKRVLLGVTGGIAAYKSPDLVRRLREQGAEVQVVLTAGALLFPQNQQTPVVVVALGIASFTYGGLLGVFFLGNFWPRAVQRDAITGLTIALFVMAFIVFARNLIGWLPWTADVLGPFSRIAWPWYVLIGTSITMIVGITASYVLPRPRPKASQT